MLNIQEMLDNAMAAGRAKELETSAQLMVGELILKLEGVDKNLPLYFDNSKHKPSGIESWRGNYRELAITYKGGGSINSDKITHQFDDPNIPYDINSYEQIDTTFSKNVKVLDLLNVLKTSIGKTMTGYKGGNFGIGKNTPIWVANYGESSGFKRGGTQMVIDVKVKDKKAILVTKVSEY